MENTKSVLAEIVASKQKEIVERKALYPTALLERSLFFNSAPVSLKKYILRMELNGIIAEFKKKSPSRGVINGTADVAVVTLGYMQAGASALSILTDTPYFGGKSSDLESARKINYCPILRKDFIIDEYQVIESKSIGADAILLIGAALSGEQTKRLSSLAFSLGMEVLFEMHDEVEMEYYQDEFLAGINSRSLHDFIVSLDRAEKLCGLLPNSAVKIAESGITSPQDVVRMRKAGFDGFLIGEEFMKHFNPGKACGKFIGELNFLTSEGLVIDETKLELI